MAARPSTTGRPLPTASLALCGAAHAILFGSVRRAQGDNLPQEQRPERGLLAIRKDLDLFANLRPATCFPMLVDASPLKRSVVEGTDLMVIRELTGGLYFGEPRGREDFADGGARAVNTMAYTSREIERVARAAFDVAMKRRKRLASVDKANVLVVSQLWREVVTRVGKDYPQVALEHVLVDNCAIPRSQTHPLRHATSPNTFGDILRTGRHLAALDGHAAPPRALGWRPLRRVLRPGTAPRPISRGRGWRTRSRRSSPPPCCCGTRSTAGPTRTGSTRRS